ncbi:hypothetical protein BaRGS_00026042 [Batillaria attramentaria]|uniref:Glycosyltransferase family 92 protein n=1 Tax=Batillaria attramentaria TaxID=370345 RepID=A0ABD0K6I4_9CAEN
MDKEKHSVNTTFLVVHYSKLHQPNGHRTNFSRSEINSENVETDTESDCTRTHLDVKNTNSTVSGVPRLYNLTRCFPPFHGRYDNTAQVAEMIAASVVLGVDHFVFYVESVGPSLKQMLEMLKKDETAEVHPWNLHLDSTSVHYFAQYSSIQDCLYRHLHTSRYLLFGDPDELFVPRSHDQLLPLLDEQFTKRPECGAFLFRNTFFNLNFPTKVPPTTNVSEAFIRQYQLPALLHPVRSKTILDPGVRSKPAVAPRKISVLGVHIVEIARKGFRSCTLDPGDGLLHHYRRAGNAGEEDRVEDPYLWRYTDAIVKETQRILNRTI